MILFTKEFAGSPIRETMENGARLVRDIALKKYQVEQLKPANDRLPASMADPGTEPVKYKNIYVNAWMDANRVLETKKPGKVVHLGGGCAMDIPVITYLKKLYPEMFVVWIDAHGDLHTPATSRTHYIHGMALGLLLNRTALMGGSYPVLRPEEVILYGVKEMDLDEREYVSSEPIRLYDEVDQPGEFLQMINNRLPLYVHIDCDVLHPEDVANAKTGVNKGIHSAAMMVLLELLKENYNVVGMSLLENSEEKPERVSGLVDAVTGLL